MNLSVTDVSILVVATVVPAAFVSWLVTLIVRKNAQRLGLIDQPGERKVHVSPTPLGGGIGIWCGFVFLFGIGTSAILLKDAIGISQIVPEFAKVHLDGIHSKLDSLWILIGAATGMTLIGLFDDLWDIGWKPRLGAQFLIALICVAWQGWRATAFISVPLIPGLISVVWIVAMINSFNMLDNMDGLSGGVALLASLFLAVVMLLSPEADSGNQQIFVAGLLFVLCGSILGFLFHNFPPARIFMGDAGSYLIGFVIATATLLATYTGYHSKSPHGILAPLFVMAVPLYDMTSVIWIRIRLGKSPFVGDKNHLSHRLVDLGFSKTYAVMVIYLLTSTCGLAALILHRVDQVGAIILGLVILCILILIALIESTARNKIQQSDTEERSV